MLWHLARILLKFELSSFDFLLNLVHVVNGRILLRLNNSIQKTLYEADTLLSNYWLSHHCHMTVAPLSHDHRTTVTWSSHHCLMTVTPLSHDRRTTVTRSSHHWLMTVARQFKCLVTIIRQCDCLVTSCRSLEDLICHQYTRPPRYPGIPGKNFSFSVLEL